MDGWSKRPRSGAQDRAQNPRNSNAVANPELHGPQNQSIMLGMRANFSTPSIRPPLRLLRVRSFRVDQTRGCRGEGDTHKSAIHATRPTIASARR